MKHLLNSKSKIYLVYPGIPDIDKVETSISENVASLIDKPYLLFVGRIEYRKGIDLLLKAWPSVTRAFPNLNLIVAGKDINNYLEKLRSSDGDIKSSLEQKNLFFLGEVTEEDKNTLLHNCHLLVVPSRYESFGITAVEGLRAGKPVIASSVGGLVEVLGIDSPALVPPDSVQCLVSGLIATLGNDSLLRQLGIANRERYEHNFTSEKMAQNFLESEFGVKNQPTI